MVRVRWPRWPPCPYMVKTFKIFFSRTEDALGLNLCINHLGHLLPYAFVWEKTFKILLLQNRGWPCGWIFACIIRNGRSTKVAKIMVIHWHLAFFTVRSILLPYAFVWENCSGISNDLLWSLGLILLKMFRISNDFSFGASGPMLLRFHLEPPWGREMKDC